MNSHRQRSRRRTAAWQAGSLALLAGAIGLGAVPLARALGPGLYKAPARPTEGGTASTNPKSMTSSQVLAVIESMKNIGPVIVPMPVAVPVEATEVAVAETTTAPVVEAPPSGWTYTGFMKGPKITRAVIQVGAADSGKQLMLSAGDEHEKTKLVEVHSDHIVIKESEGDERRIDIAARSLNAGWSTDQPRRPMAARGPNGGMNGQPGMAGIGQSQPGFAATAAAAQAEAQRRMRAAIAPNNNGSGRFDERAMKLEGMAKEMGTLTQDKRDALTKLMVDPHLSSEERGKAIRQMGMPTEMSPEEREEFLQNIGVSPESDPKLYEYLRESGGGK